jgi:hypothetical protein
MKLNKVYIIPVIAVGTALALYVIAHVFMGPAPYVWKPGDGLRYKVLTTDVFSADIPGTKSLHKRFELKGILNMRIFDVKKDRVRVAFQIEPVAISVEGQRDTGAEKLYSTIFTANISSEGEFLDFNFSNEISPDDEKNIINTIRAYQCIIRKGFLSSWTIEESDANGTAAISYHADKGTILKRKKTYVSLLSRDDTPNNDSKIDVKNSDFTASYDEKGSWLSRMEGGELLAFSSGGNIYLKTSNHVYLERIYGDADTSAGIWDENLDFNGMIARWSQSPKNMVSLATQVERAKLQSKTGNVTPELYFTGIFNKHKTFSSSAISDLMEYIRLYPEMSDRLPEYLLTHSLNAQQRAMVTHALGRVGHAEAQKALIHIINGREFQKDNRVQAVMAFSNISVPEKASIATLWETTRQTDQDIASTAVLSLGSIACSLGHSNDNSVQMQSSVIKQRLESDLKSVQDTRMRVALIHAAGNTGDGDFIKPLSSFLKDESPNVRSSAVSALANFTDGDVDGILSEKLKSEENISVRGSIVSSLEQRKPVQETVSTVLEQIGSEDNDIVRGEMYRYLAKNRDFPGVRDKLVSLKNTESSLEHRKTIIRALNSGK